MSLHLSVLLILITGLALLESGCTEDGEVQTPASFSGKYLGDVMGAPATLELTTSGPVLSGQVRFADGSQLMLSGRVDGDSASGEVQHAMGTGTFEATLHDEVLTWTMTVNGPGGAVQQQSFNFRRQAGAAEASAERDPLLVGRWRHTDSKEEFVMDTWFVINPDGTFRLGDYRMPDTPLITNESVTGQWRTSGAVVYCLADGTTEWQPLARYYIENNALLLTYADGSKLVWHRN